MKIYYFLLLLTSSLLEAAVFNNDEEFENFLTYDYNNVTYPLCTKYQLTLWDYSTDINNSTAFSLWIDSSLETGAVMKNYWENYFQNLTDNQFTNQTLNRYASGLKKLGSAALGTEDFTTYVNTVTSMLNIYNNAKICPYNKQNCDLDSEGLSYYRDVQKVLTESRDLDELQYTWSAWSRATGPKIKAPYEVYIGLSNKAAVLNGFNDMEDLWISGYEIENFEQKLNTLLNEIEPLYFELLTYVGNKLAEIYGDSIDLSDGLIPVHVLGDLNSRSWAALSSQMKPYPTANSIDIDSELIAQKYTVLGMFDTSNDFYISLGFPSVQFAYNKSDDLIEKPANRDVLCKPAAFDFCNGEDYRARLCGTVDHGSYNVINTLMAYINYHGLLPNRAGGHSILPPPSNPWHRPVIYNHPPGSLALAISNTISLSATTPKHLSTIGLLNNDFANTNENQINFLMDAALRFIPPSIFSYYDDLWKRRGFGGAIPYNQLNTEWWNSRKTYAQVKPPAGRSENDFDPGMLYDLIDNDKVLDIFLGTILQFQMYRSFCTLAGEYDPNDSSKPFYNCDLYNHTEIGDRLKAVMSLGLDETWNQLLNGMIGQDDYDTSAILEYFDPLYQWLLNENGNDNTTTTTADPTTSFTTDSN